MTQETDIPSETNTLDYDAEFEGEEAAADEEWLDEPEELPRRPRRKLLGAGGDPIALTLFVILLLAIAFFAGVQVEKGQNSSSTSGSLGSGLAALRSRLAGRALSGSSGSSSGGSSTGSSGTGFPSAGGLPSGAAGAGAGSSGGGFLGGGGLASAGITAGEVSFANGNTLYVTSSEGNTVKVSAPEGTRVTKTVTTGVSSIHPGDTVVVRGSQNKNGSVSSSSIAISSSGGSSTSGTGGSGSAGTGAGGGGAGATPQLFGAG
jgi:hypothetical protein